MSLSEGNMILPPSGPRLVAKLDDDGAGAGAGPGGPSPPALPPRPPPRPRNPGLDHVSHIDHHLKRTRVKKYVFLCSVCGGLASLLGSLFLAVYLILRTYTSSLDYFETIPTYIPAAMLMVTGLSVMCLARRRNRYVFLIKLCGLCCLMCVGTCVLVTVTTTVVHMSRLQSLRECVYTLKTQTCTCYSVLLESASERTDEGSRYVFNATPDCEAIHGALYSCLRALFGLSVIGILVCIFCCMLVYQLLSHERKKMYWEQLELRCRYLYGQASTSNLVRNNAGLVAQTATAPPTQHCACCQQFRYQQDILAWEPTDNRFWSGGQVGNLYSPNPVGDDCMPAPLPEPSSSGWSWRRLPWSRQPATALPPPSNASHRSSSGYHQPLNCSSPDSQYGFSSEQGRVATVSSGTASYTMIEPVAVPHWGPPPPYSDPNSPSRPVLCPPGPHHHHCQRGNYVNAGSADGETTFNDNDSGRVLQLRIPARRPELPLSSSSSSSIKSNAIQNSNDPECGRHQRGCQRQELKPTQRAEENNWHDCSISPRIKYLHNKLQNASVNQSRKRAQELSESEVYFADVSSCNVSVRNDSMSIYGEALDNKPRERMPPVSDDPKEVISGESFKKHLHFPNSDDKGSCLQMLHAGQDIMQTDNHMLTKDVNNFQRNSPGGEFSYLGIALDGSEEDDPELVNFSQRQASLKGRLPHYRADQSSKMKNDQQNDVKEQIHKSTNEFPSPMSISSPSTVGKSTGGFYTEVVNSDNGSSDSMWSGYSPDLLAPDAQYEVIPENRLISSEDQNGNPNDQGRLKMYLLSKKRHAMGENWSVNSSVCGNKQEFSERQKCSGHNINSQKNSDRNKDAVHKMHRSNERCLADILNSPKTNYKNTRHDQSGNNHMTQNYSDRRRDHGSPGGNSGGGGLYYAISENDTVCCDRTNLETFDRVCTDKIDSIHDKKVPDSLDASLTSAPKAMERLKITNTNVVNSLDSPERRECFHSDNSCRCFNTADNAEELIQVRSVDV